ncbi:hypothetical protein [Nitrosomonas sp.]|uniref:hypothetical protein n=1 Tax=Nitrosomonas sp. TaxID=42353 RepID=UPI00283D82AB|nr:hypothetical protein [Nitrosomonas sp.]MDR4515719.1 hypothetical protein [Nitrosomonas sp.]
MYIAVKFEVGFYYRVWFGCLAAALVASVIYPQAGARIVYVYSIPTWLGVVALNAYEGHGLMSYLKANHYEKWAHITSTPVSGPGGQNSFRSLPFLYSNDDLGDSTLAELKRRHRAVGKLILLVFVHYPFVWVLFSIRAQRAA